MEVRIRSSSSTSNTLWAMAPLSLTSGLPASRDFAADKAPGFETPGGSSRPATTSRSW